MQLSEISVKSMSAISGSTGRGGVCVFALKFIIKLVKKGGFFISERRIYKREEYFRIKKLLERISAGRSVEEQKRATAEKFKNKCVSETEREREE